MRHHIYAATALPIAASMLPSEASTAGSTPHPAGPGGQSIALALGAIDQRGANASEEGNSLPAGAPYGDAAGGVALVQALLAGNSSDIALGALGRAQQARLM